MSGSIPGVFTGFRSDKLLHHLDQNLDQPLDNLDDVPLCSEKPSVVGASRLGIESRCRLRDRLRDLVGASVATIVLSSLYNSFG